MLPVENEVRFLCLKWSIKKIVALSPYNLGSNKGQNCTEWIKAWWITQRVHANDMSVGVRRGLVLVAFKLLLLFDFWLFCNLSRI